MREGTNKTGGEDWTVVHVGGLNHMFSKRSNGHIGEERRVRRRDTESPDCVVQRKGSLYTGG